MQVDSVRRRLEDKAFTRSVNREDIGRGAFVRDAMAAIAPALDPLLV